MGVVLTRGLWCQQRLYESGLKLTSPRRIILGLLENTDRHLSAEEIYLTAVKKNPSIGLTTVYRTLETLSKIGMLQKFDFGDDRARYELNDDPLTNHHHHLVCVKCKKAIDYNDFVKEELKLMNKTEKTLSRKHRFKILHHTIHFYGVCTNCQSPE